MTSPRIYLDHAATSWPKHPRVLEAMTRFAQDCGAAAGRGGYGSAQRANQVVAKLRKQIADCIGAEAVDCISFHSGGTAALNAAIHGIVQPGGHVVTTAAEHNSVLRPLEHLRNTSGVRLTVVPVDPAGKVDVQTVLGAVENDTGLVAVTAASNVTGAVQPIEAIGKQLKNHRCHFLCDAAQTFGALPIDVAAMGIDLLAAPGHKASGGPAGTGFLYVAAELHDHILPTIQGGTGSVSESLVMPTAMPAKLEAGNLNAPALAGWSEAIDQSSVLPCVDHHEALASQLYEGLQRIRSLRVCGQAGPLPIASLVIENLNSSDVSMILDTEFGIEVRSGLHCAAMIHEHLGSLASGTVRISGGATTTADEIQTVLDALDQIATSVQPV